MSEIRVNNIKNEAGTGAPQLTYGASIPVGYALTGAGGINLTGVITATSFSVNGGSAIPGINTSGTSDFTNVQVGGALTVTGNTVITGNLQVDGTQTILNTNSLEIEDINVGIASAATKLTNSQLDGAGITIYGSQGDKTLTWDNSNTRLAFNTSVYAPKYYGDGSNLQGVVSGVTLKSSDTLVVGGAATTLNFSGATISNVSSGIATITIASAGISTTASTPSANTVVTLNLSSAQHHELTLTAGITTVTCSGGTFGDSHSVVLIQPSSGIATVGFSTYFLFPSGSSPVLSQGSGKIDLISFVVRRAGATGIATQLLASAGLDYQ